MYREILHGPATSQYAKWVVTIHASVSTSPGLTRLRRYLDANGVGVTMAMEEDCDQEADVEIESARQAEFFHVGSDDDPDRPTAFERMTRRFRRGKTPQWPSESTGYET